MSSHVPLIVYPRGDGDLVNLVVAALSAKASDPNPLHLMGLTEHLELSPEVPLFDWSLGRGALVTSFSSM